MLKLILTFLRRKLQGKRYPGKVYQYTVTLECTSSSEMTVKACSQKEAREQAAIQLEAMGWKEWIVGEAWPIDQR